jgi:arabinogalactan oligomer/maltooligosaccharide transport system substrate-binding protein
MKRTLAVLVVLLLAAAFAFTGGQKESGAATGTEAVRIALWTQEGEAEGAFQLVRKFANEYSAMHPNVTFDVLNKETEALRQDFQTASLAGNPPDLLWTVNDHAGPFVVAGIIQPVGELFDMSKYVPSVEMQGEIWAVPISSGNHLMLLYNKDLIQTPPATTDELIEVGKRLTRGDTYAIVWNQVEPFWLAPWLHGFGGEVFAEDGVTPTLNTPEMVNALKFMHSLKYVHRITPLEADYATMDTLFKEGKAAMIINGDWSLGEYRNVLGDKLGVAPIPVVSSTGRHPAPYTSGKYFMIPSGVSGTKLEVVKDFIAFATGYEKQIELVRTLTRLPALKETLQDPLVVNDAILKNSSEQMSYGVPQPSVVEMRCNWDAMKPELNAVLADAKSAEAAARDMQSAAEVCIRTLE